MVSGFTAAPVATYASVVMSSTPTTPLTFTPTVPPPADAPMLFRLSWFVAVTATPRKEPVWGATLRRPENSGLDTESEELSEERSVNPPLMPGGVTMTL